MVFLNGTHNMYCYSLRWFFMLPVSSSSRRVSRSVIFNVDIYSHRAKLHGGHKQHAYILHYNRFPQCALHLQRPVAGVVSSISQHHIEYFNSTPDKYRFFLFPLKREKPSKWVWTQISTESHDVHCFYHGMRCVVLCMCVRKRTEQKSTFLH